MIICDNCNEQPAKKKYNIRGIPNRWFCSKECMMTWTLNHDLRYNNEPVTHLENKKGDKIDISDLKE